MVTARVVRGGTVFMFHDTAGLRDDAGRVEKMGIDRTWKKVNEADIVLLLPESAGGGGGISKGVTAPVIPVWTKADLGGPVKSHKNNELTVSSTPGQGLDELWSALDLAVRGFKLQEAVTMGVVLNERHLHKLEICRDDLHHLVRPELETESPGDEVIGTMLSSILSQLGEVSGRVFTEQLLESVFQRFCVGK